MDDLLLWGGRKRVSEWSGESVVPKRGLWCWVRVGRGWLVVLEVGFMIWCLLK